MGFFGAGSDSEEGEEDGGRSDFADAEEFAHLLETSGAPDAHHKAVSHYFHPSLLLFAVETSF